MPVDDSEALLENWPEHTLPSKQEMDAAFRRLHWHLYRIVCAERKKLRLAKDDPHPEWFDESRDFLWKIEAKLNHFSHRAGWNASKD